MPGYSPIQKSFGAGEVSRRFSGQTDSPLYQRGLEVCKDFIPMPQGSLLMRGGTKHLCPIGTEEGCRLIPFKMVDGRDFVIELGDTVARVYDSNGALVGTGPNLLTNGNFAAGATGWTVDHGDVDFSTGVAVIGRFQFVNDQVSGFMHQDVQLVAPGEYELSWTVTDSFVWNNRGLGELTVSVQQGSTPLATVASSVKKSYSVTFTITDPTEPVRVYFSTRNTNFEQDGLFGWYLQLFGFAVDDVSLGLIGSTLEIDPTPWALDQLSEIQYVAAPGQSRVYFAHPDVAPYELVFTSKLVWTLQAVAFGGTAPVEWAAANYPSVIEIFQGRLWLAATRLQPTQVWYSGSGDFTVFGPAGTNASDPSSFKLQTKGSVKWMQGAHDYLLIGTESGEYGATSDTGILAPGAIKVRPLSAFGSAPVQAAFVGGQAVYVAGDRKKIRSLDYSFEKNSWQVFDLTFQADHVTRAGVKDMQYARDPNGTIVLLLDDGTLALANYSPAERVLSWYRVEVAGGAIAGGACRSMAVVEQVDGSQLWLVVERLGAAGASAFTIEVLNLADTNTVFMDGWKRAPLEGTVLTGLDHLEDAAVTVIADGARLPDTYTVVGGQIELGVVEETDFVVGLRYRATAKTLPLEGGNPQGTAQGLSVHWSEIAVRLNGSARPLINGERAAGNKPFGDDLDTIEELLTKDVRVVGSEASEGGQVTIEQDEPFRTEICGLFGQAEVSRVG